MAMFAFDDEPDSFVDVKYFYDNKNNPEKNQNIVFNFQVVYTRAPRLGSDGGEEDFYYEYLDTQTVRQTDEVEREWLFGGKLLEDIHNCQATVCSILRYINVPCYRDVVQMLTRTFLDLKNREVNCVLPQVERVKIVIDVIVWRLPFEEEDVDVKLAVAPASDEAIEAHLETVVVENDDGNCVICMDEIRVDSYVAASRMPCLHVFHRSCVEEWLRNSGICPVCRSVFPSEP